MNASIIDLADVTLCFGRATAVNNLTLHINQGEIFGLLGPNGAGKTTIIHLIAGLLRRHSGQIQVAGFDPQIEARQVRRRIGLAAQETNLYANLNAVDNLWHHAALYCDDLTAVSPRIQTLLQMMTLWERRRDPVRTYSGGMKRRLALVRALLHQPDIILFDEPTLGVDVQGRHALWEHIKAQQAEGKTFVISTNDMHEAEALCDRLAILDHGRLIAIGSPEQLKAALDRDIVTLRATPPLENAAALFDGLGVQEITAGAEAGILRLEVAQAETIVGELVARVAEVARLESLHVARPTLDDGFLHHTGRGLREG